MPPCCLLVSIPSAQHLRFGPGTGDDLQAHRQPVHKATGQRERRQASQVEWRCETGQQARLRHSILSFDHGRSNGCGGCEQNIVVLEELLELA